MSTSRSSSDSRTGETPGPSTRDHAAAGDDTLQSAMSVVPGIRRLRPDDDEVEDALRLARLRAQLLEQDDAAVRIGRFILLASIGRGGMGTVYEAYDPQLERKVAIKLLRALDDATRDDLLAEGRTLARLVHPNVVTVYEVGSHDGHSFVVMELLRGPNLRAWMRDADGALRRWPAVVDVFVEAARGLAAAHAAGIRHGDVKPDNIVVADDGRTRVVDFGIARAVEGASSSGTEASGTPPYMAPEQLAGGAVDGRADQFGFCASLFEVLHGERARAWPPRFVGGVPSWLQRVIVRGTAPDPNDRYPSFDALTHALVRGRHARRRALLGAGTIVAATVAVGLQLRPPPPDPCASIELGLHADPGQTAPRVHALIDDLERRAGRLCVAEHAPPDARPPLLGARRACLDEATAVARLALASHDVPPLVWPYVLDGLEARANCDDEAMLRLRSAIPDAPQLREATAALDWQMEVAAAEAAAGLADGARTRLQTARREAAAEVLALRNARLQLLEHRIAALQAAPIDTDDLRAVLWSSIASDHLADAVEAAALLHTIVAEREGAEPAATWFELAGALLHRAGDPATLWAALWRAHGRAMAATDRHAEAIDALARAASFTADDDVAGTLALLRERASAAGLARRWPEAEQDYARAMALHRFRHGDDHPGVLDLQLEHALSLAAQSRVDEADAALNAVIEALTRVAGPEHGRTLRARMAQCIMIGGDRGPAQEAACLAEVADAYEAAGRGRRAASLRLDRAELLASLGRNDEAATIFRTMLADDDAPWSKLRLTAALARVEFADGRPEAGLALLRERLTHDDVRSDDADAARLTEVDLLLQAGAVDEADAALARARVLAVGEPIAFVGWRGMIEAARNQRSAAIADLETGLLMSQVQVHTLGPFAATLAQLRAELDPADPRAREAAETALGLFEYAPSTAAQAEAMRTLLARLPAATTSSP